MGEVFRALDLRLQRDVALKVIRMDKGEIAKRTERLRREARALATLRHPNVVRLLDFDEEKGVAFLAMEFVDGEPLNKLIEEGQKLSVGRAAAIGAAIAEGLSAAHDVGIIHRDIKPDNVLLSSEGVPVVIDFGLAQGAEAEGSPSLTKTGHFVGTPKFVPPEVITGVPFSASSDLYQLGLVLYQMLTGLHPLAKAEFIDIARGTALDAVKPPSHHNPDVDQQLDEIVMSLLEKDVKKRPPSARCLAKLLKDWRSEERLVQSPKQVKSKKTKSQRHRHVLLFLTSFTIFFIAGLLMLIILARRNSSTAISDFIMPKGLVWHGRRGKLIAQWQSPGDAHSIELREMSEQQWRFIPLESSLSGLRPGSKYRVRFSSADNRHSPSQTVTVPYSAITFQKIVANEKQEGGTKAIFRSRVPFMLQAKWQQRQKQLSMDCSRKETRTHSFEYSPELGLFQELNLRAFEGKGNGFSVALPSKSLFKGTMEALQRIPAELYVNELGAIYLQEKAKGGDLPQSKFSNRLNLVLLARPVRHFLALRPFVPLLFQDNALSLEEKLLFYRRLNRLLPLDRFYEAAGRSLPFEVEKSIDPLSHLSNSEFEGGRTIGLWPGGLLLQSEKGFSVDFNVSAAQLGDTWKSTMMVKTSLFHYRIALQILINDRMALHYHFNPQSLQISRFTSGNRKTLDTVARLERNFPSRILKVGPNTLRVSIIPLMDEEANELLKLYEILLR